MPRLKHVVTEEEAELWRRYTKTRSVELRNRLIELYIPLARRLAAYQYKKMAINSVVDRDDLFSYACRGLMRAVELFDPSKGFRFITYGSRRINGEMLDGLRQTDWVPRWARQAHKRGESIPTEMECAGDLETGETSSVLDGLIKRESANAFWEEIAQHLDNETDREILVRHFRDGENANAIARDLPGPKSIAAVHRRLGELLGILREKLPPRDFADMLPGLRGCAQTDV